jgi:transposase
VAAAVVWPAGRRVWRRKEPSGTVCRLSDAQLEQLAAALQEGPAAHGYVEDQRWTLAWIADVIACLFRVRYTRGVSLLLHRIGFSAQMPKHRPVERDEQAVATWRREVWPQAKASGRTWGVDLLRGRGGSHASPRPRHAPGATRAHTGDSGVG